MALHTMAIRAAAAGLSLCFVVVCHSPSRSGSLPCLRGDRSARRRVFSSVLCAARGQRVLRGTEWTLCAPIGCVALVARCVRFWRRAGLSDRRACAPNPCLHCARTCCSQRGPVRAVLRLSCESRGAARGGSSLGRWRCGSCVAVRLRLRSGSRGSAGYLVDPASSHMLVSKIKPCMSKYKRYTVKLRMAH